MSSPFMQTSQIYLRNLDRSDLPRLADWISDPDVTRLLFTGLRPTSLDVLTEQWEKDQRNPNEIAFAVCDKEQNAFIGTTGLYSINWVMRTGEFRIFLGDKNVWKHGIGTACTKLMVVYGFEKLNLNRIWLGVNAENQGGLRAYEKAGFVREGVLRQEQYRNFRYYDVIRMGMLRSDYEPRREGYLEHRSEAPAEKQAQETEPA